jgi:hypothetical protein
MRGTGLDALASHVAGGFPCVADGEQPGFDLFGGKILSVVAGWQPSQCQRQRQQVQKLFVLSLNVTGICHCVCPELKVAK